MAQDMSFWGMEVPPQGEIEFSPDDNDDGPGGRSTTFLHLTNMALSSDGKDTGACSLKIQVDGGRALVLGTLGRAIGLYQYPLDVVIDGVAKFTNSGKTALHVAGYQTVSYGEFSGDMDEDEDEDEDDEAPMGVRMNGADTKSLRRQLAAMQENEDDEEEDEDFDEDEDEGGEDEDEDGIPDFEDLDPDDEVAVAAEDDEDGEDDEDEMEEGEDDEGEEESEDGPMNAADVIARQKANKKLLAPMTKEMFAGEDEEKVHMDEDEDEDEGEDDEGEDDDDEDGEDEEEDEEVEPSPPPKKASKRPQPSTPAAAEPSKKASKGENGSKQVATPASAAPAKHAASSAAATPESKEGGRKDKKEKKSAGEKAVVAAAAGGPTPVKGIAEPKNDAEYQNAISAFVSKSGGKANLSSIGSAIKRPSSVAKAGAFIKARPTVFKINDTTQEVSLA